MNGLIESSRRIALWTGILAGLSFASLLFVDGIHTHDAGVLHNPCAVCSATHAPALPAASVTCPPAHSHERPVAAQQADTPQQISPGTALGRSPPLA